MCRFFSKDEVFLFVPLPVSGLVKAINTAVDLIVAHFGTSRDAGIKVAVIVVIIIIIVSSRRRRRGRSKDVQSVSVFSH